MVKIRNSAVIMIIGATGACYTTVGVGGRGGTCHTPSPVGGKEAGAESLSNREGQKFKILKILVHTILTPFRKKKMKFA